MGTGTSILLIAVGAILKYAVTAHVSGIDLNTVGLILMIVGIVGLLLSLFWMTIWANRRRARGTVATQDAYGRPAVRDDAVDPY